MSEKAQGQQWRTYFVPNSQDVVGGLAFYLSQDAADGHLWFVISAPEVFPEDPVVCVNVTSYDPTRRMAVYNDASCILRPGDHPFVQHPSSICYEGVQESLDAMLTLSHLNKRLGHSDRRIRYRKHGANASTDLLSRMRQGATITSHIPYGAEEVLREQHLI